jgi:nicotinamide mononucleotide transporter
MAKHVLVGLTILCCHMPLGLDTSAFDLAGQPVSWAELLGFITGLTSVALAVAQRVETFPVGIAGNVFFLILFFDVGLYADAGLQLVFAALSVLGWWAWLKLGPQRTELDVSDASPTLLCATAAGVVAATLILVPVLRAAHGSAPFLDALTTSLSLGATLLLSLKKLQHWYVWMVADVIYVPLYIDRELYLTAVVYTIFLGLCIAGLVRWRRVPRPAEAAA